MPGNGFQLGCLPCPGRQRQMLTYRKQMLKPLRPGECIDYFMSHSWHDNAESKWLALVRLAEQFKVHHGRYPTFWIDKVCIDQNRIADGLRTLPVNVMQCSKMMVLCGDTYACRLWCIWELFTLLAFTDFKWHWSRVLGTIERAACASDNQCVRAA